MDKRHSLLRHPDFLRLWAGETISVFGSQFSPIAIQYAAKTILNASDLEFGILASLSTAAFLLFSLHVGVFVDRHRRRPVMIYADIGRAALLGAIPLIYLLGGLSMNLFYFVSFLTGVLTVFFDISYQSYLPSLVESDKLTDANGKIETSRSVAQAVGPSLAGFIIGLVTAPVAIIADTIGYLGSAVFLSSIKKAEEVIEKTSRTAFQDIRQGLGVVFGDARLRSIAGCTSTSNLFTSGLFAIYVPYVIDEFGFDALKIGIVGSIAAIGSIVGALISSRVSARLGVGTAIVVGAIAFGVPTIGVYLASAADAIPVLAASFALEGFGAVLYNVSQVSYRQALVARQLQGRMNATMRFLVWGTLPLGGLLGGVLGQSLGSHTAIGIMAIGATTPFLWVIFSPIRRVRNMPAQPV